MKCPDSGEPDTFDMRNLAELNKKDEVKFVISSRKDYEFARDFTRTDRPGRDASTRCCSLRFTRIPREIGKAWSRGNWSNGCWKTA